MKEIGANACRRELDQLTAKYDQLLETIEQDDPSSPADDGEGDANAVVPAGTEGAVPELPGIYLFSESALAAFMLNSRSWSSDRDVQARYRNLAASLQRKGSRRALHRLPTNWTAILDDVARDYANFAEPLDFIRDQCHLAAMDDGVLKLPPIWFDGEPGSGKSTVGKRLQPVLGSVLERISMSTAESSAMLSGSEEMWANSHTGRIFRLLVEGEYANPVVLLDEIDKTTRESRYDPLGALYQLLERELARQFTDLSVPSLPFDASHVVWIATSNETGAVPEAIRQRFEIFGIPRPTTAQSRLIAQSVMRDLQAEDPRLSRFVLTESAIDRLVGRAPREMRKLINRACGLAARRGRVELNEDDFPAPIDSRKPSLGFA